MNIKDQVIVVTGASKGLGAAIATRLAQAGCSLALVARSEQELNKLADQLTCEYGVIAQGFVCDLRNSQAVLDLAKQITKSFGHIDVLINNAGLGFYKPFLEHSVEEHEAIIDVNIKAAVHFSYGVLPKMIERQSGQIINIASDVSHRPQPNMAVYSASKFALRGFSLSLLREVKEHGIKVGLLNPGIIDTCFNNNVPGNQQAKDALQPDSVADVVFQMITQPQFQLIDELTLHPQLQDF